MRAPSYMDGWEQSSGHYVSAEVAALDRWVRVETEFRPHWRVLIWPVVVLLLASAIAVVLVVNIDGLLGWVLPLAVILAGLLIPAKRWYDWLFTKYVITNERLIVRRGLIARQSKEIPLERIDNISFSQTVGERILRSGDLVLESTEKPARAGTPTSRALRKPRR